MADKIITSADYTPEQLDCSTYDIDKYIAPFWEGNIVYNECVFPITDANGELQPFELLYKASEIISVKNYTLTETYTEGVDYVLDDGKLRLLPDTSVKVVDYSYMHRADNPEDLAVEILYPRRKKDGFEYWNEDNELSEAQICVTYIHNDVWTAPVPEAASHKLRRTADKLKNGEKLKVVVVGDSVSAGAKCSKNCKITPYADAYVDMTFKALKRKYGNDNIEVVNSARGGTNSDFEEKSVQERILCHDPDLVVIAYGMNDSSQSRVGMDDDAFRKNIESYIEFVKDALPQCEFLLLVSVYGNRYTFIPEKYEAHGQILHEIAEEREGVAVCDPQRIEKGLLEKKDFLCFMADNMVHPNDFGMRLIAQTIVHSI